MLQESEKAISHLEDEFATLQVGRASSNLVENLLVESYGSTQPVKALASISIPDAKTIQIQPWDKSLLGAIEKGIRNSDLNLNPVNNGLSIILSIPPLTEERRRDLVKVVGQMAEDAKISIRNARHDAMGKMKKMEHDGDLTEDDRKRGEKQIQEKTDELNNKVADLAKKKEESIMKI